jgi:prolipoprotein diacylglyceryltransferase
MYPTLYDLIYSLFGLEIKPFAMVNTFGLMVAISFFAAFYIMTLELKRLESEGKLKAQVLKKTFEAKVNLFDWIINGVLGFVFGWKIIYMLMNFEAVREDSQGVIFSDQGNVLAGLFIAGLFLFQKYMEYQKQKKLYPEPVTKDVTMKPYMHMGQITLIAFVSGILGAKIFHIFEDWSNFTSDPWGAIFSLSGLTYYGGLICGAAGVLYYANKNGIKPLHMLDAGAAAMMLSYGLGRAGCHLAGDGDWGIINLNPKPDWIPQFLWSSKYPHNVLGADPGNLIEGCVGPFCNELVNPVYPTPLYEIMMCLILFAVLWSIRKKINVPGMFFGIYLVMNGVERFLIEAIRDNNDYIIFGAKVHQAQIISSVIVLLGVGLIIMSKRWQKTKVLSN